MPWDVTVEFLTDCGDVSVGHMGDDFMVQNPINVEKMTSRVLVVLRPYVTILGLEIAVSSIYQ